LAKTLTLRFSRSEETPLIETADAIKTPAVDLRAHTYGTFEGGDDSKWRRKLKETQIPKVFTKRVIVLIIALGIFTYHSMTFDHLMPIFFEDERRSFSTLEMAESATGINPFFFPGGLGLSVQQVGFIMMINGAIALFVQAVCIFSMSLRNGAIANPTFSRWSFLSHPKSSESTDYSSSFRSYTQSPTSSCHISSIYLPPTSISEFTPASRSATFSRYRHIRCC